MNNNSQSIEFGDDGFNYNLFIEALSVPTKEALEILPEIQKTKEAWLLAFRLLETNNDQCMFFGAHTLQVKIVRDWSTLEKEEKEHLKVEIISWIKKIDTKKHVVISKLCQAISSYQIQKANEKECVPILDIVNMLCSDGNFNTSHNTLQKLTSTPYVLEYLTIYPEEILRSPLFGSKQLLLIEDIHSSILPILEILVEAANKDDYSHNQLGDFSTKRHEKAWVSLKMWIQLANLEKQETQQTIFEIVKLASNKICLIFEKNEDNLQNALVSQEVCAITEFLEEVFSSNKIFKSNPTLMGEIGLICLTQPWIQQAVYSGLANSELGFVRQWALLINSYSELYMEFCLKSLEENQFRDNVVAIWKMMLEFTGIKGVYGEDEDLSYHVLSFWSLLDESWSDYKELLEYDNIPSSLQKIEMIKPIMEDLFYQQIVRLLSKVQFPTAEIWSDFGPETRELFFGYRREAAEAIQAGYRVLGEKIVALFVDELIVLWNGVGNAKWQEQEARLFAIRSISEEVLPNPSEKISFHLKKLFEIALNDNTPIFCEIINGTQSSMALKITIVSLLGTYCEYLNSLPDLILGSVKCLMATFNQPKLAVSAIKSFKIFCEICSRPLSRFAPDLTNVALQLLEMQNRLDSKDIQRVYESIGSVFLTLEVLERIKYIAVIMDRLLSFIEIEVSNTNIVVPRLELLLSLVSGFARGLQASETSEDEALLGESDSVTEMTVLSIEYSKSPELVVIRAKLYQILMGLVSSNLVSEETIFDLLLSISNESVCRGPHPFAQNLDETLDFYRVLWDVSTNKDAANIDLFTVGKLFKSFSQIVIVYANGRLEWQGKNEM
ncbi:hypothetical protein BB558_004027 [Smittium angustum]|uniref:Importin N-terminal domain-containing protein n=1 Tax=Smittium angustum TaxID=133377 RepID=A0A2U1J4Q1_SMIAN|nr:hypothetical protein BB558_005722 [Smittium angustum]PVZ99942.1 hypothetical protein BB558_004027 [Smittium angustum]